jgi:signal transduction histidine kinase
MFLDFLRKLHKTFRFRLAISFSVAFIVLSLLLFAIGYFLVSSSLQAADRIAIKLKLREYADEYRTGSIASVKQKIEIDSRSGDLKSFMVRVADPQNKTLLLREPGEDASYDFKKLERTTLDPGRWIRLKANGEDDLLEIASARLPDSNVVQIGKGPEQREELLDHFRNNFLEVLFAAILLSAVTGMFLSQQVLRPVRSFTGVLGPIIDTGKVNARVPVLRSGDEFEELGVRFNQALGRIDTLVVGIKASLDNVAHDLRTPMTRLRVVAETALQADSSPQIYREALSDCLEESEQILRMLNTLMDISEVETGSVKLVIADVNVAVLARQVIDVYGGVAEDRNIALRVSCPPALTLPGDRARLLQMLGNLIDNAVKYTPSGGTVEIEARENERFVVLTIRDSGMGIPLEDLPKIWDRSFRGDKSRTQRGLGLGLSLVRAVVLAHTGSISVNSTLNSGTEFSIRLPRILGTR